jgi:hypothetical protein
VVSLSPVKNVVKNLKVPGTEIIQYYFEYSNISFNTASENGGAAYIYSKNSYSSEYMYIWQQTIVENNEAKYAGGFYIDATNDSNPNSFDIQGPTLSNNKQGSVRCSQKMAFCMACQTTGKILNFFSFLLLYRFFLIFFSILIFFLFFPQIAFTVLQHVFCQAELLLLPVIPHIMTLHVIMVTSEKSKNLKILGICLFGKETIKAECSCIVGWTGAACDQKESTNNPSNGAPWWVWLIVAIGVLGAVGVGVAIYVKRRRAHHYEIIH